MKNNNLFFFGNLTKNNLSTPKSLIVDISEETR